MPWNPTEGPALQQANTAADAADGDEQRRTEPWAMDSAVRSAQRPLTDPVKKSTWKNTYMAKGQKGCKKTDMAVICDFWTARSGVVCFSLYYLG